MADWLDWLDRQAWRERWSLDPRVTYLNHGSFGPPPKPVRKAREDCQAALDANPMDFFVRRYDAAWHDARRRLAELVGGSDNRLVFVENATHAMNVLADSMPLKPGDEIVLTDHEYGAVRRIWERAATRSGAAPPESPVCRNRCGTPSRLWKRSGPSSHRGLGCWSSAISPRRPRSRCRSR